MDIVSIEKVRSLWENHPLDVREVVFTPEELKTLKSKNIMSARSLKRLTSHQARYLATRFAAKEATIKVLGLDCQTKYELKNIEVLGTGALTIRLTGVLHLSANLKGIRRLIGSCSSTKQEAIAIVIGEQENEHSTD